MKKENKRGFFIFEPIIVLVFLGALLSASFILLSHYDFVKNPLSAHADKLISTYLASETDVFLFRELRARYVVEDSIYQFAGSGGFGTDKSGCHVVGMDARPLPERIDARTLTFDDVNRKFTDTLAFEFSREQQSMKIQGFQKEVIPYEFVVQDPFIVIGMPLQPEFIPIEMPYTVRTTGVGRIAEYPVRVSFTLRYSYKLQETYYTIEDGIATFELCARGTTEANRELCMNDFILELDKSTLLDWKLTHEIGTPVYDLDITHQYQAPMCLNKPLTLLRMTFPAPSGVSATV